MTNKRQQLEKWTVVVADSGDLDTIHQLKPVDATTNPSLLLATAGDTRYLPLLSEAHKLAQHMGGDQSQHWLVESFAALCGQRILDGIPGLVSTEVNARLSFDCRASVEKARQIIGLYQELGIDKSRILVKIAATWEGIRAAEILEEEGIHCNLTLLFCLEQAIAAAEAGATLISPFVGRILDWHLRHGMQVDSAAQDPGVQSVKRIYQEFSARDLDTIIMGASFRNSGQIEALAGCDKLTISPTLLSQLEQDTGPLERSLNAIDPIDAPAPASLSESDFRLGLNSNAMAHDLLADGIRRFIDDQVKLEILLQEMDMVG